MAPVEQQININLNDLNSINKLSHDVVRQYLMTKQQSNEDSKLQLKLNDQPESIKRFSFSVDSLLNSSSQTKKELNNNNQAFDAIKPMKKDNSLTNSINTNTDYEEDYNDEIEDDEEDKKRCTSSVSFSDYSEENSNSESKQNTPKFKLGNEFNLNSLHNFNELNGLNALSGLNGLESNETKLINHLNPFSNANSLLQNNFVQTTPNTSLPQHMQQFLSSNAVSQLAANSSSVANANNQLNEQLTAMMNAGFMPPYPSLLNSSSITNTINSTLASSPYFNSLFQPNPALVAAASNSLAANLPKPDSSNVTSSLASPYNSSSALHQPLHALNHTLNINNSFNSKL